MIAHVGAALGTERTASQSAPEQAATSSSAVTKDMFLRLLVAQIRNQDPLNPSDGTQFLTELAQFQQLEQGINSGQDIAAIREAVEKLRPSVAGATGQQS